MLSVQELAKIFGFSEKSIYRFTARKEIPYYRLGTGKKGIRFKESEILAWIEDRKEQPLPMPEIKY
jgi:excisionase family DNA binding protein